MKLTTESKQKKKTFLEKELHKPMRTFLKSDIPVIELNIF